MIGWIGRGVVTGLVGFFVTRAAIRFDPNDAAGFDRSLERIATTSTGSLLVLVAAICLMVYGRIASPHTGDVHWRESS
ncbi:MAG: DUF1206 domain-containing protein [Ilumatobacteraceae bacterium]